MANEVNIKITGFEELEQHLLKVGQDVEEKIAPKVARVGAVFLRKKYIAALPRSKDKPPTKWRRNAAGAGSFEGKAKAGTLEDVHIQDRIGIRKISKRRAFALYEVGIVGLARAYAHILEWGSRFVHGKLYFTRTFESNRDAIFLEWAKKMRKELNKYGFK